MKKHYPHPIIAREGWFFIILSLAVALLSSHYLSYGAIFFWVIFAFILQFFRDPPRALPNDKSLLVSPADGRIVKVEQCIDPYRNIEAIKVSVFMNVFNVHSNRIPINGTISDIQYNKGSFLNADLDKASLENERNAILFKTDTGHDITFVQVAGLVARRILCYVKTGDHCSVGSRYGFIRFGSRVDVYLPKSAQIKVVAGQKVKATLTTLATLEA